MVDNYSMHKVIKISKESFLLKYNQKLFLFDDKISAPMMGSMNPLMMYLLLK